MLFFPQCIKIRNRNAYINRKYIFFEVKMFLEHVITL